jgi:hypothetical protein
MLCSKTGLNKSQAEAALRKHLGMVYDICHQAVEYEDIGASPPPAVICRLAAQAVGHAATLDFTPDCTDVMAFNVGPTCAVDVGFTDVDHLCGRNAPEPCVCNGDSSAQNSFRSLLVGYGACP